MKINYLTAFVLLLASHWLTAQCEGYFPSGEGTQFELTHFNKKGKRVSSTINEIDYAGPGEGDDYEIQVKTTVMDDKNEEAAKNQTLVKCVNGVIYLDMNSMLSPSLTNISADMEVKISGIGVSLPFEIKVGDLLDDAETTIEVGTEDFKIMTLRIYQTNRKVEKIETITTTAGTFDCILMKSDMEMNALFSKKMTVKEWFSKEVGLVKSETYNKKGELEGSTELTKFLTQ